MIRRSFLKSAAAAAVIGAGGLPLVARAEEVALDPMLAPWGGLHGGVPPFDKVNVEGFKSSMLKGMEMQRAEIMNIVRRRDVPQFENTLAAMEDMGRAYDRVNRLFDTMTGTMSNKRLQEIETEMAPLTAAFTDEVVQNELLFAKIRTVYENREAAGLKGEQLRLTEEVYRSYVRRGAALEERQKARLKAINQRLATLYTQFSQNVLADEEGYTLVLESEADLAGLPDSVRASAAAEAEGRKMLGKWVITNTRSSMEPLLTYSTRRDLREKGWRMWIMRGDNGNASDNKAIMSDMLRLRTERANLLGFATHAHWQTANGMAGTPEAALDLMMKVWAAAVARSREEIADMQAVADRENAGLKIEPWDYRFYAEKVRKEKFDIDESEVKPYLQLDRILAGMFWAAGKAYGLEFTKLEGVPVYHPSMTVYLVSRGGSQVGLWYFDPYARTGKRSGAWMSEYRTQERFKGDVTPIVSNNSNFVAGRAGEPVLLSWDDASTMFHEFGHALHGLCSNVTYPWLAGTSVKRDFVEFPSQINENFLATPEVLNVFALHVKTGEPMPAELFAKIMKSKTFNQGFSTVEYLASAIYDMRIHLAASATEAVDTAAFEKTVLDEIGLPSEIVMRHRPTQFGHIFSGDGYSAGYYVYLWADTLSADAFEAFTEGEGAFDPVVAKRFLDTILSVGNSVPPDQAFRNFRGRDVDTVALMRARGFV